MMMTATATTIMIEHWTDTMLLRAIARWLDGGFVRWLRVDRERLIRTS